MAPISEEILTIDPHFDGLRIDRALAALFPEFSRNYFQFLMESGSISLNQKRVKKRERLSTGDEVAVTFLKSPEIALTPEAIPLEILFEDEHIIAINKPVGMVVHPAPGHPTGTLVNALLHHCPTLPDNDQRPGIVHRLDRETSGVIIAAKTQQAHQKLCALFSEREIEKYYLAITLGRPPVDRVEAPIGRHPVHRKMMCVNAAKGKTALTEMETLAFKEGVGLVRIRLHTGRTHQIRVHLKSINTPLLGDEVYGICKWGATRPLLHAHKLILNHPLTSERLELTAPIPSDLKDWIERLSPTTKNF